MLVLSPSQIKCYLQCKRKWFAKYVMQMPDPKGPAFTEGIAFHAAAEQYLLEGRIPPDTDLRHATMLRDGMPYLPMATTVPVETLYADILCPGVMVQCRLDYEFYDDAGLNGIGDHKTFGSPKSTMTAEQLHVDVQANICANAKQLRGSHDVPATWIYYNKKKKHHVYPVRTVLTRASVGKVMREVVVPVAKEILALRTSPPDDMNKVESNPDDPLCDHTGFLCNFSHKCRMYE